eukprot:1110309_1
MSAFQFALIGLCYTTHIARTTQADWATIANQDVRDLEDINDFIDETDNPSWNEVLQSKDTILSGGECITSSCFAQIDNNLFIIYDNSGSIIQYDIKSTMISTHPFDYPGHYCVVSDDRRYLYAIGDQAPIMIIDTSDFDADPTLSRTFTAYPLSQDEPFTCARDPSQNAIYIFTRFVVFSWSIPSDTLGGQELIIFICYPKCYGVFFEIFSSCYG